VSPFVRTVGTGSGARAVQIVWSKKGGRRDIEHVGSAHGDGELAALKGAAWQIIRRGQGELDVGLAAPERRLRIAATRSRHLWWALRTAFAALGFDAAVPDEVFEKLVLSRIVEPTSKLDSIRVLGELGVAALSYSTIKRRLREVVGRGWRGALEKACAAYAGASDLRFCLYDVSTLHWETHQGDGFREPGFSKQRRLEPQVVVGLLTTSAGFPLAVEAFEGTKAEVKTIVPVIEAYSKTHGVQGVTVVADAGMVSEANMRALQDAKLSFIVGYPIPREPWVVAAWRKKHPGKDLPDHKTFAQPTDIGTKAEPRNAVVYYQYRAKRAARDLRGIDKQVAKARRAVSGEQPVKKNRFLRITDAQVTINQELIADARARAGLRAYITDLPYQPGPDQAPVPLGDPKAEIKRLLGHAPHVISSYHELWHIEHAFRVSKHDLAARPAFHRLKDSIEAHLTIVFASLAVSQWIETTTGWSIRRFVRTLRPIREVDVVVGGHIVVAEDDVPLDAQRALGAVETAARKKGALI